MPTSKVFLMIDDEKKAIRFDDIDELEGKVKAKIRKKGYPLKENYSLMFKDQNDMVALEDDDDWDYLSSTVQRNQNDEIIIYFESEQDNDEREQKEQKKKKKKSKKNKKPKDPKPSKDRSTNRYKTHNSFHDKNDNMNHRSFTKHNKTQAEDFIDMMDKTTHVNMSLDFLSNYQMSAATEEKVKEIIIREAETKATLDSLIDLMNKIKEEGPLDQALEDLLQTIEKDEKSDNEDSDATNRNINCNGCNKGIKGNVFTCLSCEHHNLCNKCQQTFEGECLFIRSESNKDEKTGEAIKNLNRYLNGSYLSINDVDKEELLKKILGDVADQEVFELAHEIEEETVDKFLRNIINIFF